MRIVGFYDFWDIFTGTVQIYLTLAGFWTVSADVLFLQPGRSKTMRHRRMLLSAIRPLH